MNDKLDKVLDKVLVFIESGQSFVAEQAPDYVQQLLEYGMIESVVNLVVLLLLAVPLVGFIFVACFGNYGEKNPDDYYHRRSHQDLVISLILVGMVLICVLCAAIAQVKDIYKIKTAPKVYLVEKIRRM